MKYDNTAYYVPNDEALENFGFEKFSSVKSIGTLFESSNEVYSSCDIRPFLRVLNFAANSIETLKYVDLYYTEVTPCSKYNAASAFDQNFEFLVRFSSKEEFMMFLWQVEMLNPSHFIINSNYYINSNLYNQLKNYQSALINRKILYEFGFLQFENTNTYYLLKNSGYYEIYHEVEFFDNNWVTFSSNIESISHIVDDADIIASMSEYDSPLFDPYDNSSLSYPGAINFEKEKFIKIFRGKIALRLQSEDALRLLLWQLRIID